MGEEISLREPSGFNIGIENISEVLGLITDFFKGRV
jgi:hypothetical protein